MREPSKGFDRELQVGLFVFAACLVIAAFSFKITDSPVLRRGTTFVTFLDDATGVFVNSKVKIAGIDVGVIRSIELDQGRAKITLQIDRGIEMPNDAMVVPRPLGILGDKYLDVVDPKSERGVRPAEKLDDQSMDSPSNPSTLPELQNKEDQSSYLKPQKNAVVNWAFAAVGISIAQAQATSTASKNNVLPSVNTPATLDDLTRELGKVGEDLRVISGTLRKIMEGEKAAMNSPIGKSIKNTEQLTSNLNDVVVENRKDIREVVKALESVTSKINEVASNFDEKKLGEDLRRLTEAAGNLSKTVENLEQISHKINSGKGTIGRLINDETVVVEMEKTFKSINRALDRAHRTLTVVEMKSEYVQHLGRFKSYVGLSIFPREDSGYIGQLVVDPIGRIRNKSVTETVDGGVPVVTETVTIEPEEFKISLQYYRRFADLSFRIGLFEDMGGMGLDYYFFDDRLKLSTEFFDFSRKGENGNLKIFFDLSFLTYLRFYLGGAELLSKENPNSLLKKSYFVGIGLRFSDDDLKTLAILPGVF